MRSIYSLRKTCRSCGAPNLRPILSLGPQYIINFPDQGSKEEGLKAPNDLVLCTRRECSLVQLQQTVDPDILYRKFWYKSGINQTMRNALKNITDAAKSRVSLEKGDVVVDIGTNDGTLLRAYDVKGLVTVGFEPASNLIGEAKQGTTCIINNYFNFDEFSKNFPGRLAKVITSIAMFYDLEDPNQFVADIRKTLANEGVWINQMNYLKTMLEQNAFDNVSHEHLEYYSLSSLKYLLKNHGLEVFDVETNDLNGGSFRATIGHAGVFPVKESVFDLEKGETILKETSVYDNFANNLREIKNKIGSFIKNEIQAGKKIYAYGASTRGNTLLQYFGLNQTHIVAAAERNPAKYGKKMVGTNIPIISEEEARAAKPDYFLVLPWAFVKEFIAREKSFLTSGGKFIVPLPTFCVIGLENL